jgi:hypothetical protein
MECMLMRTFTGIVENGVVKLPPKARVRDGSRVVLTILGRKAKHREPLQTPQMDAEDLAFVRACRRHLNKLMRDEEA